MRGELGTTITLLRTARALGLAAKWLGKAQQASGEGERWADPEARVKALRAVRVAIRLLQGLERRLGGDTQT